MDGLDVETWAREELVDIFTLGCRSFDVDVAAFRRITEGTHIKLYPVLDDHHSTDGYRFPPIEVFRGVMANWLHQGADGLQTFNFAYASSETLEKYGMRDTWTGWPTHLRFYRELADVDAMNQRSKVFVAQRRGGGHGPFVVPNPEDWSTPRWMYFNTNMLAPLPADLDPDGRADTLLHVYVGEQAYHPMRRSRSGCCSRTIPPPTCLMTNACSASSWQPSDTRTVGWKTCRRPSVSSGTWNCA